MPEFRLIDNLRELRIQNEYSQQTVSERIHVARQTYSLYEGGKRTPDLKALCSLAELYHLSTDELLYSDLSSGRISEDEPGSHSALLPGGSFVRLTGAEARMLMEYKELTPELQKEVREFVRFKQKLYQKELERNK